MEYFLYAFTKFQELKSTSKGVWSKNSGDKICLFVIARDNQMDFQEIWKTGTKRKIYDTTIKKT